MSKNQLPSLIIEGSYKNARFIPGLAGNNPSINFDGYEDTGWWWDPANSALKCRVQGVDVLQIIGSLVTVLGSSLCVPTAIIAYGVALAVSGVANTYFVTATNGVAFTVGAPAVAVAGQLMTLTIKNTSGGALGVATFNAVYKMSAWVQPATGFNRSITFIYDGASWIEQGRTAADVPN